MNFDEYQKKASKTAMYPGVGKNIFYPTMGLAGEAGEVANKVKKIMRDNNEKLTKETKDEISHEIGDVLWYISALASELKIPLNKIATENIKKLSSRNKRNKIKGSGDNR